MTDPSRRRFAQALVASLATLVLGPAAARAVAARPRRLRMRHIHTGERLDVTYFDGALLPDALAAAGRLLRDYRSGEVHPIDPGVLDIAWSLALAVGRETGEFEIVSGFRSKRTNELLRRHVNSGVARASLHLVGRAVDLRLPGISSRRLSDLAAGLRRGGVGLYAASDFVHLDTGRPRRW